MLGLVNRSIQCFVQDTYGPRAWGAVARDLDIDAEGFETMLVYDDATTQALVATVARHLGKAPEMVLEDVGTWLVSHPNTEGIRRLLRFAGDSFLEFLHSLDDLPDRARLAVPDLELPELELRDLGEGSFHLFVRGEPAGVADVLTGVLRAMADDYGALVLLEQGPRTAGARRIDIRLLDMDFATGRSFSLAGPQGRPCGRDRGQGTGP